MSGNYPLLTILVFLPLAGCLLLLPAWNSRKSSRLIALAVALLELALTTWLFLSPPRPETAVNGAAGFFLFEDAAWIERLGIRFTLGMDGISLLMAFLTAFITVTAMVVSWNAIKERMALHYLLILVMESGIMGVFLSIDLFLFYLFWEVMLVPMFFLIGIWGHGRRLYSAVKFFLFTMAGSLLMLLAIIGLYIAHGVQTGIYSFGLPALLQTRLDPRLAPWLFAAFLLAFAIKVPLFPLHTWLPDAHTDAPTAGSVILAGLLLKTGAYGLIRFGYPLFPGAARSFAPILYCLAVVGIIYSAWIAFAQTDMKRMVAYSSVGHMGFVALGIAAWSPLSLSGSILQMVNHGITTGALFALVGMLDERCHTREISSFGGVWGKAPGLSLFFLLFAMASAGLPGLGNFAGEFLVLIGTFGSSPLAACLAFSGIVLGLVYTVRLVQDLLFTKERTPLTFTDLSLRELLLLGVMAAVVIYLGIHPSPLLELVKTPVQLLTSGPGGMP